MSEAKLTSGRYHWFIPGDVVYDPFFPDNPKKGIILEFTESGKRADILMRNSGNCGFMICSYPVDDLKHTGEHINISPLVNWFKD